ncbi:MAG: hypothetical protein OEM63_12695 [Gammaproteobacteria bacterium]|nr:hypothetical protein [Gammaproteobacteria bacterium]
MLRRKFRIRNALRNGNQPAGLRRQPGLLEEPGLRLGPGADLDTGAISRDFGVIDRHVRSVWRKKTALKADIPKAV